MKNRRFRKKVLVDVVAPPRLVLTRLSFEQVMKRLRFPGRPTRALRELLSGR